MGAVIARRRVPKRVLLIAALVGLAIGYFLVPSATTPEALPETTVSEIRQGLRDRTIARAWIDESAQTITIEKTDGDRSVFVSDSMGWWLQYEMFSRMSDRGVDVVVQAPPFETGHGRTTSLLEKSAMFFGFLFPITLWVVIVLAFLFIAMPLLRTGKGWKASRPPVAVSFADVAGHDEVRAELEEIRSFVSDPAAFEKVGARAPKGVMLVGPPGTGKTLLAKALACESGAHFIGATGSDFAGMFVSVGRSRIRSLFAEARKKAPCIIFIDEIDGVGRKRGDSNSAVGREFDATLNQLLTEMDGFSSNEMVIVIGATNRVEDLDSALLRPGRFDRQVHVGLPDVVGREAILAVHVRKIVAGEDVDLRTIARGTPGFSGADLANLVNEAAILAARASADVVTAANFEEARDKISMGLRRETLVLDDREKKLIAYHEAGHALVSTISPHCDPVHQATILPRGRSLGLVMRLPLKDQVSVPRQKLIDDLAVAMAGRAAEARVFGESMVTTGAAADIQFATDLARRMVTEWGMDPAIGMVRVVERFDKSFSPDVENAIRKLIDAAYEQARSTIADYSVQFEALAEALLERETLTGDEVREIVGSRTA